MSEDKIPKQAGVGELIDLEKIDKKCCAVHASRNEKGRSYLYTIAALKVNKHYVLLLAASLLASGSFLAACSFPRFIANTGQIVQDIRDSAITSPFILFNSTVFVVSLAIVISILRNFPLKPWPQITVSMFFVSYVCLIMKILPWESSLVLMLSVPLLLVAAAGKLCNFDE